MRVLIMAAVLAAVAAPANAVEFTLASTDVKSGSPMGICAGFHGLQGAKHLARTLLVRRADRHAKLCRDDVRS